MADLLTILFQTVLAGTAVSILLAMARESWLAREPHVGRRRVRSAAATTRPGVRRAGRVTSQRRLGF